MNFEAAILYATQRMREIGKAPDKYHFEPAYISPTAEQDDEGEFSINAFNELYILVDPQNYSGLTILSDNSAYDSEDVRNSGVHEFTGVIYFIKSADGWSLSGGSLAGGGIKDGGTSIPKYGYVEFLRVVIY